MYKSHYLLRDFHPSESLHTHTLTAHWGSRCLCFHSAHPSQPVSWRKRGTRLCPVSLSPGSWVSTSSTGKIPPGQRCSCLFTHLLSLQGAFPHVWLLGLDIREIEGSGSEVCEQWGRGRAEVPQGGWGAFGDGHQTSLLLLIGANASPWCRDPAQICFSCHHWRCCPGSVPTADIFPRSCHRVRSCRPGRTHSVGQTGLFAWFLLCTYSGLKLLNYLEKKFNHKRERPMGCFFLHQCNKPRGQKDTRTQDKFCPEAPDSLGILWCVLVKGWRWTDSISSASGKIR